MTRHKFAAVVLGLAMLAPLALAGEAPDFDECMQPQQRADFKVETGTITRTALGCVARVFEDPTNPEVPPLPGVQIPALDGLLDLIPTMPGPVEILEIGTGISKGQVYCNPHQLSLVAYGCVGAAAGASKQCFNGTFGRGGIFPNGDLSICVDINYAASGALASILPDAAINAQVGYRETNDLCKEVLTAPGMAALLTGGSVYCLAGGGGCATFIEAMADMATPYSLHAFASVAPVCSILAASGPNVPLYSHDLDCEQGALTIQTRAAVPTDHLSSLFCSSESNDIVAAARAIQHELINDLVAPLLIDESTATGSFSHQMGSAVASYLQSQPVTLTIGDTS